MSSHFLAPLVKKGSELGASLVVRETGTTLATTIECAFDSTTRKRGLLGRSELARDTAIVIAPCGAIHTFGMQFAIDVIFAAGDGRVLKVRHSIPKSRVASCLSAFAAVEMAAGEAERHGVNVGNYLEVVSAG